MSDGGVVEHGDYDSLISSSGTLSRLVKEFTRPDDDAAGDKAAAGVRAASSSQAITPAVSGKPKLYEDEERATGAIPFSVYRRFYGGLMTIPSFIMFMFITLIGVVIFILSQAWVAFWTADAGGEVTILGRMLYVDRFIIRTFTFVLCIHLECTTGGTADRVVHKGDLSYRWHQEGHY